MWYKRNWDFFLKGNLEFILKIFRELIESFIFYGGCDKFSVNYFLVYLFLEKKRKGYFKK